MDLTEAYEIVYQDLMKTNPIVRGELDFKNLRKYIYFHYIDGIEYLMEIIDAMALFPKIYLYIERCIYMRLSLAWDARGIVYTIPFAILCAKTHKT